MLEAENPNIGILISDKSDSSEDFIFYVPVKIFLQNKISHT